MSLKTCRFDFYWAVQQQMVFRETLKHGHLEVEGLFISSPARSASRAIVVTSVVPVYVYVYVHVRVTLSVEVFSSPEPLGSQGELIGWP